MKKLLAILSVSMLLLQILLLPVAAIDFNDGQLDWGSCTHEYDNVCDNICNKCGITRTVPKHVTNAFPCEDGVCIHCGAAVPATGEHAYGSTVTTPPACEREGVRTYTCTVCGHSYTEAIPAGRHVYDLVERQEPTCAQDGQLVYECWYCDHSYTETLLATGEHTYDNACDAACNVCGGTRAVPDHVYDHDGDATCNVCGAVREITDPGDVNEDGKTNNRDLVLLIRYLSGWKVQINAFAADTDGDGGLTMKDAALLQRYLNGWDVELV